MKKFFLIVLCAAPLFAAFELQQLNTEIIGTGGIVSMHPFGNNPGFFPDKSTMSLSTNYTNLFGIKDLHCWDFGLQYKIRPHISTSFKANSVGSDIYQENTYSLAYSHRLEIPVAVGVSISYYDLSVSGFSREQAAGLSSGITYYLKDNLKAATLFGNVNRPRICNKKEALPEFFAFGVSWQVNSLVSVSSEIFKDTIYPFNFRIAAQLQPLKFISLFTGMQTDPDRFSGGISIKLSKIQFTSAFQTHLKLPNTYYFGCSFMKK